MSDRLLERVVKDAVCEVLSRQEAELPSVGWSHEAD